MSAEPLLGPQGRGRLAAVLRKALGETKSLEENIQKALVALEALEQEDRAHCLRRDFVNCLRRDFVNGLLYATPLRGESCFARWRIFAERSEGWRSFAERSEGWANTS